MLGFQGGVSIPLVKGGVKAPPAKRQCRAGPKAGARRGFTYLNSISYEELSQERRAPRGTLRDAYGGAQACTPTLALSRTMVPQRGQWTVELWVPKTRIS